MLYIPSLLLLAILFVIFNKNAIFPQLKKILVRAHRAVTVDAKDSLQSAKSHNITVHQNPSSGFRFAFMRPDQKAEIQRRESQTVQL